MRLYPVKILSALKRCILRVPIPFLRASREKFAFSRAHLLNDDSNDTCGKFSVRMLFFCGEKKVYERNIFSFVLSRTLLSCFRNARRSRILRESWIFHYPEWYKRRKNRPNHIIFKYENRRIKRGACYISRTLSIIQLYCGRCLCGNFTLTCVM